MKIQLVLVHGARSPAAPVRERALQLCEGTRVRAEMKIGVQHVALQEHAGAILRPVRADCSGIRSARAASRRARDRPRRRCNRDVLDRIEEITARVASTCNLPRSEASGTPAPSRPRVRALCTRAQRTPETSSRLATDAPPLRGCEKIYCAQDLALRPRRAKQGHSLALASRRCSESSWISIYTPVARPIHGTRPFSGLALRFAPGETVLRSGGMRPLFARDDFFHNLSELRVGLGRQVVANDGLAAGFEASPDLRLKLSVLHGHSLVLAQMIDPGPEQEALEIP